MSRLANRINFSVMTLVGLVLTIAGIYFYVAMQNFMDTSSVTDGVVIELRGAGSVAPVVRFIDKNGQERVFTSRHSSSTPRYDVGERVQVIYAADDDQGIVEAYLYGGWELPVRQYGVLLFGVMFFVLGIVFARVFWNRDRMSLGFSRARDIEC